MKPFEGQFTSHSDEHDEWVIEFEQKKSTVARLLANPEKPLSISARSKPCRYYRRNCYTTLHALFQHSTFALRRLRSCKSLLREEQKGR
jgi:hypothetical protein